MPSKKHRDLVNAVRQRVGGRGGGFVKTVLKAAEIDPRRYDHKAQRFRRAAPCLDRGLGIPRVIAPDVFLIKPDDQEVICYEIESRSAIDEERLINYVNWFWFLDDQEWKLRLFIIRAYSSHGVAAEHDLFGISSTWSTKQKVHIVGQLGNEIEA